MEQFKKHFYKNKRIINGTWENKQNHKLFADCLGKELGYKSTEDWYRISKKLINKHGGGFLVDSYYSGSPSQFVEAMFPEYVFLDWKFKRVQQNFWDNHENQKRYTTWLGEQLGYKTTEDWYEISGQLIVENYGGGLFASRYSNSPSQFVRAMFPEYVFLDWKFKRVQQNFWDNHENHKRYAEWLGAHLGFKTAEDWYQVTQQTINENYGGGLLVLHYSASPSQFVKAMFPEHVFFEWKFGLVPVSFWDDYNNQKRYTEWLGDHLGYKTVEDWYQINSQLIIDNYGCGLLCGFYSSSPSQFVRAMFPEHEFLDWNFSAVPKGYWVTKSNHTMFATYLGTKLGYRHPEDWYQITAHAIHDNNGGALLNNYYFDSPSRFVKAMFPEHKYLDWKFDMAPLSFWDNYENQKRYAEWLGNHLNYKTAEDWYQISGALIIDNHGSGLLNYYSSSPSQFVRAMFPVYEFLEWKFKIVSNSFWNNYNNQKRYAEWLGDNLGYICPEDWYQVRQRLIYDNYGRSLLTGYYRGSPFAFVKAMFPHYPWILSKFKKSYSYGQIQWLEYLRVSTADIRHALNDKGEYRIPNSRFSADGYSERENCIYEYHGDFWHGNPELFNSAETNSVTKTSFGELYRKTLKKQQFCQDSGYKYCFVWESAWIKGQNAVVKLQRLYKNRLH